MSTNTYRETAVSFFFEHAGWSYDPATETPEQGRRRCAERLADSEAWASAMGVRFNWHEDFQIDHAAEFDCYADGGPETCECVLATLDGECVGSLSCIDDATDEYRRVVEAEVASEARAEREDQ